MKAKERWWSNRFLKWRHGRLYLKDRPAVEIAAEYGTPLFVYSLDQIKENLKKLKKAFELFNVPELIIAYAMKANPHPEILRCLLAEDCWIDAVSPGEVREALKAGFPGKKIIFTGTSLSEEDLKEVMFYPEIIINIDALEQLELMKKVRQKFYPDQQYQVAIRWNPGIGRGFNSRTTTAGIRSPNGFPIKFGIEANQVIKVFKIAKQEGFIPIGLHQHLGSGWISRDWPIIKEGVRRMIDKAVELIQLGFNLEFLDFGGGISPRYEEKQKLFPLDKYAAFIFKKIKENQLPIKKIILEPGKFLVAEAGVLLTKVVYLKRSYGQIFVCVNAGTFNTVPRPAIYPEAYHHIINCLERKGRKKKVTIAGHLCEAGDIFGYDRLMSLPQP
ncbi:MAG: diaminopimelate decarboxylase, partial [Candidatus Aminicenantes bacterium]|nr:diaminopimelate decarboxylase [Candidatus Aminicenantes bacterium]